MNALNMKGIREHGLLQALKRHEDEINNVLKLRDGQLTLAVNQEDSRRSKRIKKSASSSAKNTSGYVNQWR
jgi:hypothetical protein